jgi:hypothetical protein
MFCLNSKNKSGNKTEWQILEMDVSGGVVYSTKLKTSTVVLNLIDGQKSVRKLNLEIEFCTTAPHVVTLLLARSAFCTNPKVDSILKREGPTKKKEMPRYGTTVYPRWG